MFKSAIFHLSVVLLALTKCTDSFLTVRVEINPAVDPNSTLPTCSDSFARNFQGRLSSYVINATNQISSLADFIIPSGLHLTFFNPNVTSSNDTSTLSNNTSRTLRALALKKDACGTCNSAGCALSCGIGVCKRCMSSRRELRTVTLEIKKNKDQRMLEADWSQVGVAVTNYVTPLLQIFLLAESKASLGCLGDPKKLMMNVTYLSNIIFNPTLEAALISAFGAPSLPPTTAAVSSSANACCSQTFATCVSYCGTTQQQCAACFGVAWLTQGPPQAQCTSRWGTCTSNITSCCPGLSCVGDTFWKGCLYLPEISITATLLPTRAPTPAPTLQPTRAPTPPSTLQPTRVPTPVLSLKPSPAPMFPLPTRFPTYWPTPFPTNPSTGCCSQDFAKCVSYCGTTPQECQSCSNTNVVWLPTAPLVNNTCTARWKECSLNVTTNASSCCGGLTCVVSTHWKSCQYRP